MINQMIHQIIISKMNNVSIIITAAGSSTRFGGSSKKEYLPYNHGTVLSNCVLSFLKADYGSKKISDIYITVPKGRVNDSFEAIDVHKEVRDLLKEKNITIQFIDGGNTRQESIYHALTFMEKHSTYSSIILIHDGARPFVTTDLIENCVKAAEKYGAVVPAIEPIDTQKEITPDGFIKRHLVRSNLRAVQTPQAFDTVSIIQAYKQAMKTNKVYTDDTEIWDDFMTTKVKVIKGDVNNIKITFPEDVRRLKW